MFGILFVLLMTMTESAPLAQNNSSMLYVVTYVDVQLNSMNQGIALVKRYREAALSEKGHSSVDVVQEIGRPNHFVIVEVWKDDASFEAHEKSQQTVQFRTALQAIHNSPYDQRVHRGLSIDPRAWASGPGTVSVVTHVDVPPPRAAETEALLRRSAEDSRKDDGNVRYDIPTNRASHESLHGSCSVEGSEVVRLARNETARPSISRGAGADAGRSLR